MMGLVKVSQYVTLSRDSTRVFFQFQCSLAQLQVVNELLVKIKSEVATKKLSPPISLLSYHSSSSTDIQYPK